MKNTILFVMLSILLLSCGNNSTPELTAEQLITLSTGAGMLARNLAYLPGDSSWSEPPGEALLSEIEQMSVDNAVVWPTFFRAAADTALKLDQLELQAQQEAIQAEML